MSAAESSPPASPRGATDVTVAAGVEAALADVQRQLARQATDLRLVHSAPAATPVTLVAAPAPAPVVAAPAPPKAPRPPRARRPAARVVAPVPVRPEHEVGPEADLFEDLDDETGTTAAPPAPVVRRPVQRRIDLDDLSPDQRAALGRLQARKVGRVVRDVSPWSVFKFSLLFWVCVWLILTVAGVILWKVGQGGGVVANVEKFYAKAAGEETFEIDGRGVFRAAAAIGAVLTVALTGLSVLIALLFNLVSDLTGGIRLSVVELESTRRPVRATGAARFRTAAPASTVPPPSVDPDGASGSSDEVAGTSERTRAPARSPDATGLVAEPDDDVGPPGPPTAPTLVPDSLFDSDGDTSVSSGTR